MLTRCLGWSLQNLGHVPIFDPQLYDCVGLPIDHMSKRVRIVVKLESNKEW